MKLTKPKLKQIIKEELQSILIEQVPDTPQAAAPNTQTQSNTSLTNNMNELQAAISVLQQGGATQKTFVTNVYKALGAIYNALGALGGK